MSDANIDRIIVAGGGPTGLVASLALAQQDIPVLMLEAQETPEDHRRATTFHPPTLEYLRELGVVDPSPICRLRVASQEALERVADHLDAGLLQHHLADPDGPGIGRASPGQIAAVAIEPAQQGAREVTGRAGHKRLERRGDQPACAVWRSQQILLWLQDGKTYFTFASD